MLGKLIAVAVGAAVFYFAITEYLIPNYYQYRDYLWYAFGAYILLGLYYATRPERRSFWG